VISRIAFLSFHTSPLAMPGSGDAGGMNVYVDALARTFAGMGMAVDVFTAAFEKGSSPEIQVRNGYRVVNVDAPGTDRAERIGAFAEGIVRWVTERSISYDVIHSHYWLSAWAGALLEQPLGAPLVISFHTLGRTRDVGRGEPPQPLVRLAAEAEVIARAGCVVASTPAEATDLIEHYAARPERVCVSPPGVDHGLFHPGDQVASRIALGIPLDVPVAAVVGRIQPLKGIDLAIEAVGQIPDVRLVVVGGASGEHGESEVGRLAALASTVAPGRVDFLPPMDHGAIAALYRAVDLVVIPSRSESFGLVAVEAQACGTPVVAGRIGGLAFSVSDGQSGALVDGEDVSDWAKPIASILGDPDVRRRLSAGAVVHSSSFSWSSTAARLLELYRGLV
jgi:D-inositol-3-phosphate glycosyltransferase